MLSLVQGLGLQGQCLSLSLVVLMCGHLIDLPVGLIVGLSKPTPHSVHQPLPDWIGWSRLFLLLLSEVVTWYGGFYCPGHRSLSVGLILRIKYETTVSSLAPHHLISASHTLSQTHSWKSQGHVLSSPPQQGQGSGTIKKWEEPLDLRGSLQILPLPSISILLLAEYFVQTVSLVLDEGYFSFAEMFFI